LAKPHYSPATLPKQALVPLPSVDPKGPRKPGDMVFPPGYLMGTATSASQIEGGNLVNNITRWAAAHWGYDMANNPLDHWNRIIEDYTQLAANGHTAHGIVIDWGRVEPERGVFDMDALNHYLWEIKVCKAMGMEPNVTFMEYAYPTWLEDSGGLLNPDAPKLFVEFVEKCLEVIGDEVNWFTTMNEPNTLIGAAYVSGVWSPGVSNPLKAAQAYDNLLHMHAGAANAIKASRKPGQPKAWIGMAHIVDWKYAYNWTDPVAQILCRLYDAAAFSWFSDSMKAGKSLAPIGSGVEIPGLKDSINFFSLNYYGRNFDTVPLGGLLGGGNLRNVFVGHPNPDEPADPPNNFDADGIYETVLRYWNQFHLPMVISENGVDITEPDTTNARGRYYVDIQAALWHVMHDVPGLEIPMFLNWTDWDSPEWDSGWTQFYGMYGFDHKTGARTVKPGALTFEAMVRRGAIPAELLTDRNRQSPAERDGRAAEQLRVARQYQRQHGGVALG
jgi:beta-glucosidase